MKHNLNLFTLLLALTVVGCQKEVARQTEDEKSSTNVMAAARTSTSTSTVYLNVQVEHAEGTRIFDDRTDPAKPRIYTHGVDRVDAQLLSSDGNFYMNTNNTSRSAIRKMSFVLNDDNGVSLDGQSNYSLRTAAPENKLLNPNGTKSIQTMDVGQTQYMQFRAWGVGSSGVVNWRLVWKNGYESDYWNTSSPTDYALVKRETTDRWVIVPAGYNTTPGNAAHRKGQDSNTEDAMGYYVVPFKLILTRKTK